MKVAAAESETEIILLANAKEKKSFAHLAAAAQACTSAKAERLYNQLALDELRHLLTLVSLMGGLTDDWLTRLDLTLPTANLPDPLPQTEEAIFRSATEEEDRSQDLFGRLAQGVDREELLALLESLWAEEAGHRAHLVSMLYGLEADQPVVATRQSAWLQSIRRMIPAMHLH